ncbi:hypothetical protein I4I65_15055, partial [Xanthomonas campestris pv. campestris]|nr:hypothetical protein [Xanthomonas campestris pv. campestris]
MQQLVRDLNRALRRVPAFVPRQPPCPMASSGRVADDARNSVLAFIVTT